VSYALFMKNIILSAALLLSACQTLDTSVYDQAEQELLGDTGANPNPLTFWWWAGDGAELRPALECALARIRAATCLPVDVSFDAAHWVRQKPPERMNGLVGHTGGSWAEARISLKTPMGPQANCRVLVHEIAQHVLQMKNDDGHIAPMFRLSAPLIESICDVQERLGRPCGCFNPETDDNPVESDQIVCEQ
jgi:hypothetical protein